MLESLKEKIRLSKGLLNVPESSYKCYKKERSYYNGPSCKAASSNEQKTEQ
ncbi:14269_t:CDS:1, partial [Gigaspora rosea]